MKVATKQSQSEYLDEKKKYIPIPLDRPPERKDEKESQTTFKLRSLPTQANSPTYEVTMKYFDTGKPEEFLSLRTKFEEICTGQNLTTGVQRFTLMRTLLRGDAFAAWTTRTAAAGAQTLANLQLVLNGVTQHVFPERALQKQKRYMRRFMRKPQSMTIRVYAARVAEINEHLTLFPPFLPNQSLSNDKILEILEFAIPRAWQHKMTRQGYDPLAHSTQDFIQFCERLEETETDSKPAATNTESKKKRVLLNASHDAPRRYGRGERQEHKKPRTHHCRVHGNNDSHSTRNCYTLKKEMGINSLAERRVQQHNKIWNRSRNQEAHGNNARKFTKHDLNALVEEKVIS